MVKMMVYDETMNFISFNFFFFVGSGEPLGALPGGQRPPTSKNEHFIKFSIFFDPGIIWGLFRHRKSFFDWKIDFIKKEIFLLTS